MIRDFGEWNPVDDFLPPIYSHRVASQYCYVVCDVEGRKGIVVSVRLFYTGDGPVGWFTDDSEIPLSGVTHWQFMPRLPKLPEGM